MDTSFGLQVPEPRYLTGEEQKSICKLAVAATSSSLAGDDGGSSDVRCLILDQQVTAVSRRRRMQATNYDVTGTATLFFDASIDPEIITEELVNHATSSAVAIASDFVVSGALPQSSAPSVSLAPTISHPPTMFPSTSPTIGLVCTQYTQVQCVKTSYCIWDSLLASCGDNPNECQYCDDRASDTMETNGEPCESNINFSSLCTSDHPELDAWEENEFCQFRCYQAGLHYGGPGCCDPTPPPTLSPVRF